MFALGVDYGTNSVRALVVRCSDGAEFGIGVSHYPSGENGILLDPLDDRVARQHPGDYLLGLEECVAIAMKQARQHPDFSTGQIVGIGVDTTGSSPLPLDRDNRPLALNPSFADNMAAQCWLWKDHTSWAEAAHITKLAAQLRPQFTAKCGGTYSSEWWWAKIWHCLNIAPDVFDAADSWAELADWIPSVLAGVSDPHLIKRGICAAGHKALFSHAWGGLPDEAFLAMLHPKLADLRDRLYHRAFDAREPAGHLCAEWAIKLDLPDGIPVAICELDVHYGAIGCGVTEGTLVKVIGTSTYDCAIVNADEHIEDIPGMCGIVEGSILPGFYGIEAGQSAVGDIFNWWVTSICGGSNSLHEILTEQAAILEPGQSGLLCLDWNNGNRTILVDQRLSGLILGQTLHTTPAEIYRALIEGTAFGARVIIERLREYGVRVDRIMCTGGIADRNPLLLQIYADVTGCTTLVAGSSQTCALGAAMAASVISGTHRSFDEARRAMTSTRSKEYRPIEKNRQIYGLLFRLYRELHDSFGGHTGGTDLSFVMKDLLRIKHIREGAAA